MKWITNKQLHVPQISKDFKKLAVILVAAAVLSFGLERLIAFMFYGNDVFFWGRYMGVFVVVELVGLFICFREVVAKKVEIAVLVVILSVGTLYGVSIPSSCGVSWDDEWHYYYPMLLSHVLRPGITEAEMYYMNNFPQTALERKNYDRESQQITYQEIEERYQPEKAALTERTWPRYRNFCYLPAAFGLWLGRLLHLPYHMTFMLGRWFNLLFYAVLVYLAIRKLKSGKMLAAVIALLPFNIFMASSYSYDPWITAWFLYGFCCFFGELQQPEKKMTTVEWLCMIFAFFIGAGPKLLYIPLLLLTLLLPKEKYTSPKQRKIMFAVLACVFIVACVKLLMLFTVPDAGGIQDTRGGEDIDAFGQISYIFSHPWEYTKTLLGFLADYVSPKSAVRYFSYLHYFTNLEPTVFSSLMVVTLTVVTFTDKGEVDNSVKMLPRIACYVLSFGVLCLVATSMYVAFTAVGSDTIKGCQYRYIAPVMFPVLYSLGSGRLVIWIKQKYKFVNRIKREYYNGIVLAICAFVSIHAVWVYAINQY